MTPEEEVEARLEAAVEELEIRLVERTVSGAAQEREFQQVKKALAELKRALRRFRKRVPG